MKTILTDRPLNTDNLPKNICVKTIKYGDLCEFDGNTDIIAVSGSRAMAITCADMNLPSLKLFQLTSAGFDGVPLDKFAQKGVAVANAQQAVKDAAKLVVGDNNSSPMSQIIEYIKTL